MKVGVTLGCIVATLIFLIIGVTKFNSLDNRLQNLEGRPPRAESSDESSPNTANLVQVTTKEGKEVMVEPIAVNVTAKELACLKLIDDYTETSVNYRAPIKQQLKDMRCFEESGVAQPPGVTTKQD